MTQTTNLSLPFILAAQSQKHVTHNEALRALDAIVHLSARSRTLAAPPAAPSEGHRYLVPPAAGAAWSADAGSVAAFQDGAWSILRPQEGWLCWIADEALLVVWRDNAWITASSAGGTASAAWTEVSAWTTGTAYVVGPPASVVTYAGETYVCTTAHTAGASFDATKFIKVAAKGADGTTGAAGATGPAGPGVAAGGAADQVLRKTGSADYATGWADLSSLTQNLTGLGIGTTSDTTNRLAVKSAAVLLDHAGNGVQTKLNKAAPADTASFLFQTGYSGRAEFGLTGDDDWHLKVSADGATWREAAIINRATGEAAFPLSPSLGAEGLLVNGAFLINQRVFAGGALTAGAYGFDRWRAGPSGASVSVSSGTLTLTTGAIEQVIEPSLFGYGTLASTGITVSVENPTADLLVTLGSASGTIPSGTGRRGITLTTAPGDGGNLTLRLARATSGSVSFARVKAEVGGAATPWRGRSNELRLCQRYFAKSFAQSQVPSNGIGDHRYAAFAWSTTGVDSERISYPVVMRTTPTIALYKSAVGTTNGVWAIYNGSAYVSASACSTIGVTDAGFMVEMTVPGLTFGWGIIAQGQWAAEAEL